MQGGKLNKAFEELWSRYPRKKGKERARGHFKAQVKTEEDLLKINKALDNYIAEIKRMGVEEEHIKHGSTWFNHNWEDDVTYKPPEKESNSVEAALIVQVVSWMSIIGTRKSEAEMIAMIQSAIKRYGSGSVNSALEKMNHIPSPSLRAFWLEVKR